MSKRILHPSRRRRTKEGRLDCKAILSPLREVLGYRHEEEISIDEELRTPPLASQSQHVVPRLCVLTQKSERALHLENDTTGGKLQHKPIVCITTSLTTITLCPLAH